MSRRTEVAQVSRRSYWRETDARVMVEAWQSSGETLCEFADRHGVDPRRVARWASRLAAPQEPGAVRFHRVRVAGNGAGSGSGLAIEIKLSGGLRVRVPHGFEAQDLRRVLAVLEEGARC